jgi:hypothetical protein
MEYGIVLLLSALSNAARIVASAAARCRAEYWTFELLELMEYWLMSNGIYLGI